MKLISMIDFVLEQNTNQPSARRLSQIIGYAEFLKQPLKLEMFVPCDDRGNYLEEPALIPSFELEQYRKAKEKVLFKNIRISKADLFIHIDYTIEDLIKYDLELTENAIKLFM